MYKIQVKNGSEYSFVTVQIVAKWIFRDFPGFFYVANQRSVFLTKWRTVSTVLDMIPQWIMDNGSLKT